MKVIALVGIIIGILAIISIILITSTCSCSNELLQECPEGQEIQFKTEKQFLCGECSESVCVRTTS